jgi:hypothetical protein
MQELVDSAAMTTVAADIIVRAVQAGTQNGATWGLDRIDQQSLPLNGIYNYAGTAFDVTAYIIDTGVPLLELRTVQALGTRSQPRQSPASPGLMRVPLTLT